MSWVDPEGPEGWIKDPCPHCPAKPGQGCVGPYGRLKKDPHMGRERAWAERRAREQ